MLMMLYKTLYFNHLKDHLVFTARFIPPVAISREGKTRVTTALPLAMLNFIFWV